MNDYMFYDRHVCIVFIVSLGDLRQRASLVSSDAVASHLGGLVTVTPGYADTGAASRPSDVLAPVTCFGWWDAARVRLQTAPVSAYAVRGVCA